MTGEDAERREADLWRATGWGCGQYGSLDVLGRAWLMVQGYFRRLGVGAGRAETTLRHAQILLCIPCTPSHLQ